MKTLATICVLLSLFITAYCFVERQILPEAQYTKVLSELKAAGINDKELIERVRGGILGVRTTWPPLLFAAILQNVLLVILLATMVRTRSSKAQQPAPSTQS
jgi:hypothetical protein